MKKIKYTLVNDVFSDTIENISPPQKITNSNSSTMRAPQNTVNNDFDLKSQIYQAINKVYSNFIFTKTSQVDNYGVYKARVECQICTDIRYLVAIVENDIDPVGSEKPIYELNWVSFQTRSTKNINEFKKFGMTPMPYNLPVKSILNDKITKMGETREKTVYQTENLPLTIEVIHSNEDERFAEKGTVIAVLELYQTVITFNE